jgi:HEPN domain-containing protein
MDESLEWLRIAKSNLAHGKKIDKKDLAPFGGDILYEELCYDFQQSTEKSFKALLVFNRIKFDRTHNIAELIDLLTENGIKIPDELLDAATLTIYAIQIRYPGDIRQISEKDYQEALEIAEKTYNWAREYLKGNGLEI